MRPESAKYLYDIIKACEAILHFVKGKTMQTMRMTCYYSLQWSGS